MPPPPKIEYIPRYGTWTAIIIFSVLAIFTVVVHTIFGNVHSYAVLASSASSFAAVFCLHLFFRLLVTHYITVSFLVAIGNFCKPKHLVPTFSSAYAILISFGLASIFVVMTDYKFYSSGIPSSFNLFYHRIFSAILLLLFVSSL